MFFIKLFCDTQEINKLLIRESYDDYIKYYNKNKENDKKLGIYYENLENYKKIVIFNLVNYCKNYPFEKISKHRFINEYREFPYRLEQNIYEVLLDL